MCCFSQPVQSVRHTRIYARRVDRDRQYLVYQMQFQTARPNAMILPLPVPPARRTGAVRFINLEEYPEFFAHVDDQFRRISGPIAAAVTRSAGPEDRLPVEAVGDFIASFVPTVRDFARLDPRFAIKPTVWRRIPRYSDYGFAVFQLKAPPRKLTRVHPMALEFRSRFREKLFFPTVHIHDGRVHPKEEFDHTLYWQGRGPTVWTPEMERATYLSQDRALESRKQPDPSKTFPTPVPTPPVIGPDGKPVRSVRSDRVFGVRPIFPVDIRRAKGIYAETQDIHRWIIQGTRANEDILV